MSDTGLERTRLSTRKCSRSGTSGIGRPWRTHISLRSEEWRVLRNFEAGIYYVASHGSDTRHHFLTDQDRVDFVERLGYTFWRRGVELLSYV